MNSFIYPQLASLATAAVASFLAKEKEAFVAEVGPQAGQKVGGLLGAIEKQWRDQPAAANLLLHLRTQPNHKSTLQQRLLQEMTNDPGFAQTVHKHLTAIGQDSQGSKFLVQIYGGEVSKIINIGYAEVVNID